MFLYLVVELRVRVLTQIDSGWWDILHSCSLPPVNLILHSVNKTAACFQSKILIVIPP
jgi:hypothetical protein